MMKPSDNASWDVSNSWNDGDPYDSDSSDNEPLSSKYFSNYDKWHPTKTSPRYPWTRKKYNESSRDHPWTSRSGQMNSSSKQYPWKSSNDRWNARSPSKDYPWDNRDTRGDEYSWNRDSSNEGNWNNRNSSNNFPWNDDRWSSRNAFDDSWNAGGNNYNFKDNNYGSHWNSPNAGRREPPKTEKLVFQEGGDSLLGEYKPPPGMPLPLPLGDPSKPPLIATPPSFGIFPGPYSSYFGPGLVVPKETCIVFPGDKAKTASPQKKEKYQQPWWTKTCQREHDYFLEMKKKYAQRRLTEKNFKMAKAHHRWVMRQAKYDYERKQAAEKGEEPKEAECEGEDSKEGECEGDDSKEAEWMGEDSKEAEYKGEELKERNKNDFEMTE